MSRNPDRPKHKTQRPALTAQDVRFAQLLIERAATKKTVSQCYVEAGFSEKGNAHATNQAAYRRVKNRAFRLYYRQLQDSATAAAMVTVEDLAREFRGASKADVRKLMGPDGEMLPPSQWPDEVAQYITRIEVEELTEMQEDPANPRRKKKVAIGTKWKVWLENKTECRRILAQWKRMIGTEAEATKGGTQPLVINGADPEKL